MSYSCFISFKKMKEKDIIPFLKKYKKTTTERLEEIAKENFSYVPYIRNTFDISNKFESFKDVPRELQQEAKYWARSCVFQYKYFYDTKNKLLCIFGVPTCMYDLFDKTIYFQNSCDQDYERENWEGVEVFEKIYDKWQAYSDMYIKKIYKKVYGTDFDCEYGDYKEEKIQEEINYCRRSFAYDEIWKHVGGEMYSENEAIFLSLYGNYEICEIISFVKHCHEAQIAWEKELEKELEKK